MYFKISKIHNSTKISTPLYTPLNSSVSSPWHLFDEIVLLAHSGNLSQWKWLLSFRSPLFFLVSDNRLGLCQLFKKIWPILDQWMTSRGACLGMDALLRSTCPLPYWLQMKLRVSATDNIGSRLEDRELLNFAGFCWRWETLRCV